MAMASSPGEWQTHTIFLLQKLTCSPVASLLSLKYQGGRRVENAPRLDAVIVSRDHSPTKRVKREG